MKKLESLKGEKFKSFENDQISNPVSIFGGHPVPTKTSDQVKDSIDAFTSGQSCNGSPCDWRVGTFAL